MTRGGFKASSPSEGAIVAAQASAVTAGSMVLRLPNAIDWSTIPVVVRVDKDEFLHANSVKVIPDGNGKYILIINAR